MTLLQCSECYKKFTSDLPHCPECDALASKANVMAKPSAPAQNPEEENVQFVYMNGLRYYIGKDVGQDPAKAFECFKKAAEQGYANAQEMLGLCYARGEGVEKDVAKAVECFKKAALQGYEEARHFLDLYEEGANAKKPRAEKSRWTAKNAKG